MNVGIVALCVYFILMVVAAKGIIKEKTFNICSGICFGAISVYEIVRFAQSGFAIHLIIAFLFGLVAFGFRTAARSS